MFRQMFTQGPRRILAATLAVLLLVGGVGSSMFSARAESVDRQLENFESYSNVSELQAVWGSEANADLVSTERGKMVQIAAGDTFVMRPSSDMDLTGYSALQLWMKGSGAVTLTIRTAVLKLPENVAEGESKREYCNMTATVTPSATGGVVEIPFSAFQKPWWWTKANGYKEDAELYPGQIQSIAFSAPTAGSLLLDDITLLWGIKGESGNQGVAYSLLDNFNNYSDTNALQAAWGTQATARVLPEGVGGKVLGIDGGTALVLQPPQYIDFGDNNALRLWMKGSGTVTVTIRSAVLKLPENVVEGEATREYCNMTAVVTPSATGDVVEIPFSAFQKPWWWTRSNGYNEDAKLYTGQNAFISIAASSDTDLLLVDNLGLVRRWEQESFVLSTFFAVGGSNNRNQYEDWLSKTKAAGIDQVELTFLPRAALLTALEACETVGLRAIAQDSTAVGGIGGVCPAFTEQAVQDYVELLAGYDCLEGYFVWDEPSKEVFSQAALLKSYFQKYAPDKLAYSCVYPSYGVYNWGSSDYNWQDSSYTRYIDGYLSTIRPDVLALNYYPFAASGDNASLIRNDLWRDMGYVRKRAAESGIPYWHYFQGVGNFEDKSIGAMTVEKIMVQMYAGLAYGAKGLSYFTSYGLLLDATGIQTSLYAPLTAVNTKAKSIGNLLLDKTPVGLYHGGLTTAEEQQYYLDPLESSSLIAGIPSSLIAGIFRDSGSEVYYLVLVNKNYQQPMVGTLSLRQTHRVSLYDGGSGQTTLVSSSANTIALSLPAGECAVYILE